MSEIPAPEQNTAADGATVRYSLSWQTSADGTQTLTAVDRGSGEPLAVREIPFPPDSTPDERRALAAQAKWEADRLALLHADPAVQSVYGAVEEDGRLWIITEALPGTDLTQAVAGSGPLPLAPVLFGLLRKNPAELPPPLVARDQINTALGLGAGPVASPAPAFGPGMAPGFGQGVGADVAAVPQRATAWAVSRTLWLLAALASAAAMIVGCALNWGVASYPTPEGAAAYSGSLLNLIRSFGGGGTTPVLTVLSWVIPMTVPLLGTVVLGAVSAARARRMTGWLCAGSALLGLVAEIGAYLWVADVPATNSYGPQPSVSLHLGGYLGFAMAAVALVCALAAPAVERKDPLAAAGAAGRGAGAAAVAPAVRILTAVPAGLAVVALFLPFDSFPWALGNDMGTIRIKIDALQWNQFVMPTEACCLIAVVVLALGSVLRKRPIAATYLVAPMAIAFVWQIMMLLQLIGLNELTTPDSRQQLEPGSWAGLVLTAFGLLVSTLGYLGSKATAGQPYYALPAGVAPLGYPPVPPQGGYVPAPQSAPQQTLPEQTPPSGFQPPQ
jgi:hypothetical protein